MVTVRGSAESIESRLLAGVLRCPCGGRLGPWADARPRLVAMEGKLEGFWPRRGRCGGAGGRMCCCPRICGRGGVYGAAVIMAVLVLGVEAAAAGRRGRSRQRPGPGAGGRRPSTARSWRSRFAGRAGALREQSMRPLPLASGRGGGPAAGAVGVAGR